MASICVKWKKLWARSKNESGKWGGEPTPYRPGQEVEARRYVKRLEVGVAANRSATDSTGVAPGTPLTVAQYAKKWIKDREPLHLASHKDDSARLKNHVLPKLGQMELAEVRPRRIREFVLGLRGGALAPRSIHHVFT